MKFNLKFSFEFFCIIAIIVLLFGVRYGQFNSSLKSIEADEVAWVITSLFNKHQILASEKGLWELNDAVAKSFPTGIKINQLGFYIFGNDIYSARKILAVFNILSMLTFYFLCRRFFSPIVAFCITILYSFSTYKLISARIAIEPAYADLFLYLFIFLILLISESYRWRNYVFALLAVVGIIAGSLSYGLSFFFPVLGIILLLIQLLKNKLKLKEKIIIFLIFIVPLIVFTPKWLNNIKSESENKQYALSQVVFDLKTKEFNVDNLKANIFIIHKNLFKVLAYRSGDMLVNFEDTIVPPLIVYLAIAGFLISIFNVRKYYPLYFWLGLSFIPMIIFGLYLARMWINIVGVFFIFAGITIQKLTNLEEIRKNRFTPVFLYAFLLLIVYSSLYEYFYFARNNPSFSPKIGEIVTLTSRFEKNIEKDIVYISDEWFSQETIYPITTFYYLGRFPEKAKQIKQMTRKEMRVYSHEEFLKIPSSDISKFKYFVVDNSYKEEIIELIESKSTRLVKTESNAYFSILYL